MAKHHHQNRAELIINKEHGAAAFHYEPKPQPSPAIMGPEDITSNAAKEYGAIQRRAYQIHHEKGGVALDNWLEAERALNNNHDT